MLRIDASSQYIFNSWSYHIQTPDGTMYVNILEDKTGVICAIDIVIGKAGAPLRAWAHSFARIITLGLEHGVTLEDLLTELSSQTSDHSRTSTNGIQIRSGPEGIYQALIMYRRDRYEQVKKDLGIKDDDGRRGRLRNAR